MSGLAAMRDEPVWGVVPGSGTIISIEIGAKLPLWPPLKTPHLSEELRMFQGSFGLFIECTWRLQGPDRRVLCSSAAGDPDRVIEAFDEIRDSTISSSRLDDDTLDLFVDFSAGHRLTVFCDAVDDGHDNYSLFMDDAVFTIGSRGRVTRSKRYDE